MLLYLVLSWKERVDPPPPAGFGTLLGEELSKLEEDQQRRSRLEQLLRLLNRFTAAREFHPFMSDIVGNTICADLLDYLARDRLNLGMENRFHRRLQRYLTIRPGSLYADEGYRISIMVTRQGKGGQRRDVATAVLDIMRDRYEMAERVFYHHKKAAAGAMLAKLVELAGEKRPRDDDALYPATWQATPLEPPRPPHMAHLSDAGLIDYLGTIEVGAELAAVQRRLHAGLTVRRRGMYRTLLVVDTDLVQLSHHTVAFFTKELRDPGETPPNERRAAVERELAKAADADPTEVILYCPPGDMQAKLIDARLEIRAGRVLPLRTQTEQFAYSSDVEVLEEYYREIWRLYVFVSPDLFRDARKCKAIVDAFCDRFGLPRAEAYLKVRTHSLPDEPSGNQGLVDQNDPIMLQSRANLLKYCGEHEVNEHEREELWAEHARSYLNGSASPSPEVRQRLEPVSVDEWGQRHGRYRRPRLL